MQIADDQSAGCGPQKRACDVRHELLAVVNVEQLLENDYWVGVMTIVTFYALFMDDIRFLWLPKSADLTIDICTIICMSLYLIELFLGIIAVVLVNLVLVDQNSILGKGTFQCIAMEHSCVQSF